MGKWFFQTVLILTIFEENCIMCQLGPCEYSLVTVEYVSSCPSNKVEAAQSASRKNCEHHAKLQTCTNPNNFKYHCLINAEGNKNIEVCAPGKKVNGFCTEFDTDTAILQDNYNFDCSKYDPPCPKQYNSTEAYLYRECYECNWEARPTLSKTYLTEKNPIWSLAIAITSSCCIIGVVILMIVYFCLKNKSRCTTYAKKKRIALKRNSTNGEVLLRETTV